MTLSSDDLQAIRNRAEAATPGPWVRYSRDFREQRSHSVKTTRTAGMVVAFSGYGPDGGGVWCDAEFIAHARTDIPALLAHIDALEAERAEMTEEWGRAFWTNEYGERVLFVDDDNGAFRDYADVAQYVPPIHEESPYDFIVSRRVTPWLPVEETDR